MTITSLGIWDSLFSAREPDGTPPAFTDQPDRLPRKGMAASGITHRIEKNVKLRSSENSSCCRFSDLFGHDSLLWSQHSLVPHDCRTCNHCQSIIFTELLLPDSAPVPLFQASAAPSQSTFFNAASDTWFHI